MKMAKNQTVQIGQSGQSGQIVVEYVLLLLLATAIAVVIMTSLVKRDSSEPENSGALIKRWRKLQDGVAKDMQD